MNIRKSALLVAFLGLFAGVFAQNKQLTVEECIMEQRGKLYPATLKSLSWLPSTDKVAWLEEDPANKDLERMVILDIPTKNKTYVTLEDVNFGLKNFKVMYSSPSESLRDFKKWPQVTWESASVMQLRSGDKLYNFDYTNRGFWQDNYLPAGAQNEDRHKGTGHIAYTSGNNLYIKPKNGNEFAITYDTMPGIVNGQSVHRNEFGITKGTFWNNKGDMLAYYRMDESMVTDLTYYGFNSYPGKNTDFRYPMAGQTSHQVKVAVYNTVTRRSVYLETGEPLEQYLTNVTWSPDDKYVYVACLMREQDHLYLKRYEAATGKLDKILFEEKNSRYVEPEHGPLFVTDDSKKFIWQSERDGYNHLYLYNTNGELVRQLTKGDWMVTEVLGFDEKGKTAYFTSTKKSPLDITLHSVELKSGRITDLAFDAGRHFAMFNSSFTYFVDNKMSFDVPRTIDVKGSKDGKQVMELMSVPNPVKEYQLGKTEIVTIRSTDNTTDLYARIIKPTNFDPNKKYPVVVYVYGGPHAQMVTNGFLNNADLWMNYMAEQGYVVFTLDNRGSANRGFEFESSIHRRCGSVEIDDQLAGVKYLKSQSFVDSSRMAVFGWSYGGFMATSLMLKTPGTFKVGIAGGPVIDWRMYEVMYTERYMDTPLENPPGYDSASLLNYVQNLQGKLLMIHGTSDDVVVWQHSLTFIKKAVDLGKQMDYFVYPGHAHNVRGKDRVHLYQKVTDYITENLE